MARWLLLRLLAAALVGAAAVTAGGCGAQLDRPTPMAARIVLTETGGLAGMVNVLSVDPDGSVSYQTRQGAKTTRLSQDEMESLVAVFYDKGFFAMKDDYRPERPVADGITISLVYSDAMRSKTVITATNGKDPAGLQDILRRLNTIIAQTR